MARTARQAPIPGAAASHVVLLRGVNVGGKNRLSMKELEALLQAVGCEAVRTYIQSGNAVLRASPAVARRLPEVLSARLEARFGLTVPVIVRTAEALREVARRHPLSSPGVEPRLLHVAFLSGEPTSAAVKALDPERSPPDRFEVRRREVYLSFPNGSARSRFTVDYLDRTLGTTSTWRNWRTVQELVARLG
jgi:uncharacterized protein (DUF1697 family)